MNARSQLFEFSCESCMVSDIVSSVFNTVLFHRTLGKFHYHTPAAYSVGAVGFEDVDLPVLDVTHVRCSSPHLKRRLDTRLAQFSQLLSSMTIPPSSAQISLEFFQRRHVKWPFGGAVGDSWPWEVWTVRLDTVTLNSEKERCLLRERLADALSERLLGVARSLSRPQYMPHTPAQSELEMVFDTSLPDVQPYLYRVDFHTDRPTASGVSVGSTVKKLIKDTLTM